MTNLVLHQDLSPMVWIGSVSASTIIQVVKQLVQLAVIDNPTSTALAKTSTTSTQSTDINLVQTSKTSRRKKHNQCKKNAPTEQSEENAKEPNASGNKGKKKLKFPCLAYKEDHFTSDSPRLRNV